MSIRKVVSRSKPKQSYCMKQEAADEPDERCFKNGGKTPTLQIPAEKTETVQHWNILSQNKLRNILKIR